MFFNFTMRNFFFLPILLSLTTYAAASAVIFTPALPQIASYFDIPNSLAQFLVTVFLLGYASGQLIYGPLSNRFGRKAILSMAFSVAALFAALSVLSFYTESFALLMVSRFFNAFAGASGLTVSFTMIGDVYTLREARKAAGWIAFVFAITPALMMAIGGALVQKFAWVSCFYFIAVYTLLLLALILFLPETLDEKHLEALKWRVIKRETKKAFAEKVLVPCGLIMGCSTVFSYVLAAKAPFIGIVEIGMTPLEYGLFVLWLPLGITAGTLLNRKLVDKYKPEDLIVFGASCIFIGVFSFVMLFAFGVINAWTLFMPNVVSWFGVAFTYSNSSPIVLKTASNRSVSSSFMNGFNLGMGLMGTVISSFVFPKSALMMPLIFAGSFLIMVYLVFYLRRMDKEAR